MCVYVCVSNLCTYCYLHSSVGISSIMDECVEFCTMCVDRIILNEHFVLQSPWNYRGNGYYLWFPHGD